MTQKIIVTGGLVSIEDGLKAKEEYAPAKKVRVELKFDVPEGEDASGHLSAVSVLASNKVYELLTGKAAPVTPGSLSPKTDKEKLADAAGVGQEAQAAADKPKRAPRAPKPADAAPAAPAASLEDELNAATATAPAAPVDEWDTPPAEVKPITDADLTAAAGRRNAELKDPAKIRGLVATFFPSDRVYQLRELPQEKRQSFLDKLAALV